MKISVVTATYNSEEHISILIESLRVQTDKEFEWVVVDGLSSDATLSLLNKVNDLNMIIISEADFGIYDALNKGILRSSGEFYLVIGSDDFLYPDAIENFKKEITDDFDIIAASLNKNGVITKARKKWTWLYNQFSFVAGHSAATLFRKSLHERFGLYSHKFPIAADQYFIKTICQNGARIKHADFVSGYYSLAGLSGTDFIGTLTESFRVQVLTERYKFIQFILFVLRFIKHYRRVSE